ncbi:MAG TPA: hypothetical protein VFE36_16670 [Candidatus Baltobacteraceae bacterium]|nr:hypothetical protein [Candidatus Baltobacteraceae bacterium]
MQPRPADKQDEVARLVHSIGVASDHSIADHVVDVASVILISAATVLSALCGYQATRWSGDQARLYNVSSVQRMEAAESLNRSLALTAINVNLFLNYAAAVETNDTRRRDFIYKRFPPKMRRALDEWLATKPLTNPLAPSSPFVMRDYADRMQSGSRELNAKAAVSFRDAQLANQHSDNFMLLTVIFAAVSFLGGVSTKMQFPRHVFIIVLGAAALIYGIARLSYLPFL